MTAIKTSGALLLQIRQRAGLTQREFAERLGTSQPAVARLEQNKSNPTIETLERSAAAAGFTLRIELVPVPARDPVVERYKQDVDRTLLRENLRKSIDERVRTLGEWQEATEALQRATRAARQQKR